MTVNEAPALDYARNTENRVLVIPAARSYGSCFGASTPGEAGPARTYGEEPDGGGGSFRGVVIRGLAGFAGRSTAVELLPSGPFGATEDRTVKTVAPAGGGRLVVRERVVRPGHVSTVVAGEVLAVEGRQGSLCTTVPIALRGIDRAGAGR